MQNGGLKAVILIGGPHVGTRFRPLSLEVPQPLFPIAGSPMIQHHVEACTKLSLIKEILVIGFYQQSRELTRFLSDIQKDYGTPVRYLQEHCRLRTGGGIYHFRDQILSGNPSAFFVFNSDVCCDFPVKEMYEFQRNTNGGKICVMLGTEANEAQAHHYGCIVEDNKTHEVLHFVEKPETFVSTLINAGAYLFTPEIFRILGDEFKRNYEEPNGKSQSCDAINLERSIFNKMAGTGKLFVFKTDVFWSQIKTAGNAIYANRLYLSLYRETTPDCLASNGPCIIGDVRIHPTAVIDPTAVMSMMFGIQEELSLSFLDTKFCWHPVQNGLILGPNVYVGSGVTIGPGARVKEAIILDRAEIMEHCCVLHCIIGWECEIGPWSRIEGQPSDPNPNDPHAHVPTESLFNDEGRLNPSITILGQGVVVHSELMIRNSIVLPHKTIQTCYHNQIIL